MTAGVKSKMNRATWANATQNPRGERELRYIGWDQYVKNLKQPYPPEMIEAELAKREHPRKDNAE